MSAEIIPFKPRNRKQGQDKKDPAPTSRPPSDIEIFTDVLNDVMGEWQTAAIANGLSEYICSKIPSYARGPKSSDYVGDLNVISSVETKLELSPSIFAPGATPANAVGWLVTFRLTEEVLASTPPMVTEAMARALNIVLAVSFEKQKKLLGRS